MNPLEFACVRGYPEILKYLTIDLGLNSKSDFNVDHATLKLEQMPFIFVPIIKKNTGILEILLNNLPHLWSFDDLTDMLVFMKQSKWRNGMSIVLKSSAMHFQYRRLNFEQRFKFVRDCMMIPYRIEDIPNPEYEDDETLFEFK